MSRHPLVKWAQRSDKVFIKVDLPDAEDVKLKLEPEGKFSFSATKDGNIYQVDLELFDKINVEESKYNVNPRSIMYSVIKEEKKWWARLTKQDGKPPLFLKVDWDKWVEEDEENEKGFDFEDMDFSKLDMGGDDDDYDEADDFKDKEEEKEGVETAAGTEEPVASDVKEAKSEEPNETMGQES